MLGSTRRGNYGCTTTHYAAKIEHISTLAKLDIEGEDLNRPDRLGNTLLHHKVIKNDDLAVAYLLGAKVNIEKKEYGGNAALHFAIYLFHTEIAAQLLEAGANPNVANKEGFTPLHIAAENEGDSIVLIDLLLKHGADPAIRSASFQDKPEGYNTQELAELCGNTSVKDFLLRWKKPNLPTNKDVGAGAGAGAGVGASAKAGAGFSDDSNGYGRGYDVIDAVSPPRAAKRKDSTSNPKSPIMPRTGEIAEGRAGATGQHAARLGDQQVEAGNAPTMFNFGDS